MIFQAVQLDYAFMSAAPFRALLCRGNDRVAKKKSKPKPKAKPAKSAKKAKPVAKAKPAKKKAAPKTARPAARVKPKAAPAKGAKPVKSAPKPSPAAKAKPAAALPLKPAPAPVPLGPAKFPRAATPGELIQKLRAERAGRTDAEILAELRMMAPLPPESDAGWTKDWKKSPLWQQACLFVALADELYERQVKSGLTLLLERASCGDPGELFRMLPKYLCHIAELDWEHLLGICMFSLRSTHAGARLWATETIGFLRHEYGDRVRTLGRAAIETLVQDPEERIRNAAFKWLQIFRQEAAAMPL